MLCLLAENTSFTTTWRERKWLRFEWISLSNNLNKTKRPMTGIRYPALVRRVSQTCCILTVPLRRDTRGGLHPIMSGSDTKQTKLSRPSGRAPYKRWRKASRHSSSLTLHYSSAPLWVLFNSWEASGPESMFLMAPLPPEAEQERQLYHRILLWSAFFFPVMFFETAFKTVSLFSLFLHRLWGHLQEQRRSRHQVQHSD